MRIILFLSFLLCTSATLLALEGLQVKAKYHVDPLSMKSWGEISKAEFHSFKENEKVSIGFNENAAVWVSIEIANTVNRKRNIWLCFDNIHIDSFQVVNRNPSILLGDRTTNEGPYLTSFTAPVDLAPYGKQTIVLRLKKTVSFFDFSFTFRSDHQMKFETRGTTFYVAFFLGIVFLLIIINGILFFLARKKIYILYIFYSILTSVYMLISTGFMKYYLIKEFLYFSEIRIYAGSLWFVVIGLFLGELLDLKKRDPFYHKAIGLSGAINLITVLISFFFLFGTDRSILKILMSFNYLNFFFTIFFIILATIRQFKYDRYNATYVLMAFAPLLMWTGFFMLYEFSIINATLNFDWLALACVYEVALFGYVLGSNYFRAVRQSIEAKQELLATREHSISMIVEAQISERTGIASILHDKFSGGISNISHLIEINQLEVAKSQLDDLGESLRQFSHEMMPKSIEEGALIAGLRKQIEVMNEGRTKGVIHFESYDFPKTMTPALSQALYLISLEIIGNAWKHGDANNIFLEFYGYPEQLVFNFHDDGKGFDQQSLTLGFGLQTIKARVEHLQGDFDLSTELGEGVEIQITIPFNA